MIIPFSIHGGNAFRDFHEAFCLLTSFTMIFLFWHSCYNLNMSPFYTRTGDDGSTSQLGEGRLPKNHPRIETVGTIDEVSAAMGLSRALCQSPQIAPIILDIQRDLYTLMAEISATSENEDHFKKLDFTRVEWLESQLEILSKLVPIPTEFIIPGDSLSGAALALCRTIVRRAERCTVGLFTSGDIRNPFILQYLNRLSSLCFALELLENQYTGHQTTLAKK
jgi:cob(I)alamin adenosyltransferase